jgi:hypothetical protein
LGVAATPSIPTLIDTHSISEKQAEVGNGDSEEKRMAQTPKVGPLDSTSEMTLNRANATILSHNADSAPTRTDASGKSKFGVKLR